MVETAITPEAPAPTETLKKELQVLEFRPQFGEGREELSDGGYYEGSFRFGKREGPGVLVYNVDSGERYEGQFRSDCLDGDGKKLWPDGTVYEGQWKAGRKDGEGVLTETKARSYKGQWKDGKRHGIGTQTLDGESRYEGRWENGLQHGTGRYYDLRQETVYEGQWSCGAHHGRGLLRSKGGAREKLAYTHGMLTAREEMPLPKAYPPIPRSPQRPGE
mmetsp:Transcript_24281/g.38900  ORF Transcript_24281/g.38900 Transcript_24281/m.38900 type:complete len:218 (+) Transcript_24281:64-717(+)